MLRRVAVYRKPFSNVCRFSTSVLCYAKRKRGHGQAHGNVNNTGTKSKTASIQQISFKPINNKTTKTSGLNNNIIDEVGIDYERTIHWKKYIDGIGCEKTDRSLIMKNSIEKLLKFSEYSEVTSLENCLFNVLKKHIAIYDQIVGPVEEDESSIDNDNNERRFEFPENIKMGILHCRDNGDYGNMVRLYDYFFQLLVKSPLGNQIDHREELSRLNEIDNEENSDKYQIIDELIDKLYQINRDNIIKDEAVNFYEKEIIKQIEFKWYEIEKPRNLQIYNSSFNKIIKLLKNETYFTYFNDKFIDDFLKDLITSDMNFEYDEFNILINNIKKFQKFDFKMYKKLTDEILKMNMIVTPDIYKLFIKCAIENKEFKLAEIILKDFSNEKFVIDREIFQLLQLLYSNTGDIDKFLRLIDLEFNEFSIVLFKEDFKILIESMIRIGLRSLAVDFFKSLIIINNGFIELKNEGIEKEINREDLIEQRQLYDGLMDLSLICSFKKILMTKPEINDEIITPILITCDNFEEYEKLSSMVTEIIGFKLSSEFIKIELLMKDKFGLFTNNFTQFQQCMVRAIENLEINEIDKLICDYEFVEVFNKIVDNFVATKELDIESDNDVAEAYGAMLVYEEHLLKKSSSHDDSKDNNNNNNNNNSIPNLDIDSLRQQLFKEHAPYLRHILVLCGISSE